MSDPVLLYDPIDANFEGVRGRLTENFPLSSVTWFRVGGPAQLLFQPADEEDLALFLSRLPEHIPVRVIGLGSNLLVRDGGIKGVVIKLSAKGFGQIIPSGDHVRIGAAVPDKKLAQSMLEAELSGFAFYHGIPGSIGGALRMNAGAHGTETKDRLTQLVAYDRAGNRHVISLAEMGYSYRHAEADEGLIFTEAVMTGPRADPAVIAEEMAAVQKHREEAQPIREKTGGSTFKNPLPESAWKVIDAAGCRGLLIGGAQMSPLHCNFMINTGEATGQDLEQLGETVRKRVFADSGIQLHWEIKRWGAALPGHHVETLEESLAGGNLQT